MNKNQRKDSAFTDFRKTHGTEPKHYTEIQIQGHYWSIASDSVIDESKKIMKGFAELKKELEC